MKFLRKPSRDTMLSVAVFGLLLVVYVNTLLPGVGFHGDTPKLQFLGRFLGIPHPTGFPTYLMINHVFVRVIPMGSLAWKSNLLSAVLSAAAAGLLFRLFRGLGLGAWTAVVSALIFGLTRTVWLESLGTEVYTLHLLFMVLVIYMLLRWRQTEEDRYLRAAVLIYALSFGNHLMAIMLAPAIAYLILATRPKILLRPDFLGWIALSIVLGASQYGYLFWRTAVAETPYIEHAITNFAEFWHFVSGAKYRGAMFGFTPDEILTFRLPSVMKLFWLEFTLLLPVALVGMVRFRDGVVRSFLLIYFLVTVIWAVNYRIQEVHVYFLPAFMVLSVFTGVGLDELATRLRLARNRLLPAALLAIPAALLAFNHGATDQSGNTMAGERSEELLKFIGGRAVIITSNYNWSQYLWYYLIGEGWQERNLYVVHHFQPRAVRAYLERRRPIHLPEQRRYTPTGLAVYCFDEKQAAALVEEGLRLESMGGNLVRVHPPLRTEPGTR